MCAKAAAQRRSDGNATIVTVDGRRLRLTNLDKVLYPATGFTKGQVIEYYGEAAGVLLAHLRNRAVAFKRYPDSVDGESFYQKNCPDLAPKWLDHIDVPRENDSKLETSYCLLNNTASLIWAANLAALEFHPLLSTRADLLRPTAMVFDLDPGPDRNLNDCARISLRLRDKLEAIRLQSWVKTSGLKGLHILVPLNTACSFDQTKAVARAIGAELADESPDEVTVNMRKSERKGRLFVDWSQNDEHKTMVAAYSLRATPEPNVATPLDWDEVGKLSRPRTKPDAYQFGPDEVLHRIDKLGDLFQPVLTLKQYLPHEEPRLPKSSQARRPVAKPAPLKRTNTRAR